MSQWLKELETDSARARSEAVETLCQAGPVTAPALLAGLRKRDLPAYRSVWLHLPTFIQKRLGPPADYSLLHHRCAYVLGYIEPSSPRIVQGLRLALASDDDTLKTFAAQALRMIAERDEHVTAQLQGALPELRRPLGTRKDDGEQVARAVASIERKGL
jgi:hypothetical protein